MLTDRHIGFFYRPRYENEITNTVNVDECASTIVNQSIAEESLFQRHDSVSDVSKHLVLRAHFVGIRVRQVNLIAVARACER